jgi:hypothetical protein
MSLPTCLVILNTKRNTRKIQLTSVKEGIIPFSLFFDQKVIVSLMNFPFEYRLLIANYRTILIEHRLMIETIFAISLRMYSQRLSRGFRSGRYSVIFICC